MSKSIFVIETPESCSRCNLKHQLTNKEYVCCLSGEYFELDEAENRRLNTCPLIPYGAKQKNKGKADTKPYDFYKTQHKQRIQKNPARLDYAAAELKKNNIPFRICNEQIGQINCRFDSGKILTFYAGTGKIAGCEQRGIDNFVALCIEELKK